MDQEAKSLTASMEDYLEMICRLSQGEGFTRTSDLAEALNVQPSSATRMVKKLAESGFIAYERYGILRLTPEGRELGNSLLQRHQALEDFLRLIGVEDTVLEDTERMEHSVSEPALRRIIELADFLRQSPQWRHEFERYRERAKERPVGDLSPQPQCHPRSDEGQD